MMNRRSGLEICLRAAVCRAAQPAWAFFLAVTLLTSACNLQSGVYQPAGAASGMEATQAASQGTGQAIAGLPPTPFPTRPLYQPGELVEYIAQTGDTLPVLAARFNTSEEEIRQANTFIPESATTMPPGMPMKIPIYYLPFWGSPYKILPDSLFINGPAQVDFDTRKFVSDHGGWLKNYTSYVSDANRSGAEIVDLVARNYSLSPRLLLALLEYHSGALSRVDVSDEERQYPLGNRSWERQGLFLQLAWAANLLNNGYYSHRKGQLTSLDLPDGRIERIDPWQNSASAALMNYFNQVYDHQGYLRAASADGIARTYVALFGDPWQADQPHIAGSLAQPAFTLPFDPGYVWAHTGGPHTAWGRGEPLAALDFAPPMERQGCEETDLWATAVSGGVVARVGEGEVLLDLDGDGDERTGWVVYYLHLASDGKARPGQRLQQGERIGHPSCEGGSSTGTHVHIARKYNGEWIPADGFGGVLAFDLEGWLAHDGREPYLGTLTRAAQIVTACTCSNRASFIQTERP